MGYVRVLPILLSAAFCGAASWEIRAEPEVHENDIEQKASSPVTLIFPGTRWCGSGNISRDDEELGQLKKTDSCCRDHDHCTDVITAFSTKNGLYNSAPYTRLSCDCDERFLKCLKRSRQSEEPAAYVGLLYFDVLGTQCFRLDHPATGCLQYSKRTGRCLKYSYNTNGNKIWQWFDVPPF